MKKLSILFLSLVALATSVTSCSKNDNATPAATTLQLTIKDELGAVSSGATVKLYDDANFKNLVATGTSDATGKVTFNKDLKAVVYYFDVTNGCRSNFYSGDFQTAAALKANQTTTMDVKLAPTIKLNVTNSSTTNMWAVTITQNGVNTPLFPIAKATSANGTTTPYTVAVPMPAGTYTVVMQELKPDATAFTDTTGVTKNLEVTNSACGDTKEVAVP